MTPLVEIDSLAAAEKAATPRGALSLSVFETMALACFARAAAGALAEVIDLARSFEAHGMPMSGGDVRAAMERHGLWKERTEGAGSPDGAVRNPGSADDGNGDPDCAAPHPGYDHEGGR
jgi:hypothetical protein